MIVWSLILLRSVVLCRMCHLCSASREFYALEQESRAKSYPSLVQASIERRTVAETMYSNADREWQLHGRVVRKLSSAVDDVLDKLAIARKAQQ
jgi:hypothetical protein